MNIRNIKIIVVGKIKTSFYKEAYAHYINRIKNFVTLEEINIKDADSHLSIEDRKNKEGDSILKHISAHDYIICLDEHGKSLSSVNLSYKCNDISQDKKLCFIIGGAYGHSQALLSKAHLVLSFGKQTLPHELAQVVLSEQIFRVCTILKKTGYHHE